MKRFLKRCSKIVLNFWVQLAFFLVFIVTMMLAGGAFSSWDAFKTYMLELYKSADMLSIFLAALVSLIIARIVVGSKRRLEESLKIEDDHHKIIAKYKGYMKTDVEDGRNFYNPDGILMSLLNITEISREDKKMMEKANKNGGDFKTDKEGKTPIVFKKVKIANPVKDVFADEYKIRQRDIDAYSKYGELYLPSINVYANIMGNTQINLIDSDNKRDLPKFVSENALELMAAHHNSKVSNNVTVRLKNIDCDGDVLKLVTERSQYFDMLVTNRCMDYELRDSVTLRSIYEPSDKVSLLGDSVLGNQIGINGLIITNDNYLLVEKRGHSKTTWKNKFAQPISLALKWQDLKLPSDVKVLQSTAEKADEYFGTVIYSTIQKNFGLTDKEVTFSVRENFMGIARDLLEGGKPNMYFFVKVDMDHNEFQSYLEDKYKKAAGRISAEKGEKLPKISRDKMDSNFYLINYQDIAVDFNYAMTVKAKNLIPIRREYKAIKKGTEFAEYNIKKNIGLSVKRECGEAFLACMYYLNICKDRVLTKNAD